MDKKDSRRKKANCKQKGPTRKPSINFERCVLFIAVASLVVNFFVFVHIKKDSRLQHRAWVGLKKGLHQPIVVGKKIECQLRFTNTGKTPAINVSAVYTVLGGTKDFDVVSYVESHTGRFDRGITSRGPVPPNSTLIIKASSDSIISEEQAAQIKSGKLLIYVFGGVTYEDVFGETHHTHYCYIVDPANADLSVYNQYNSMD